MQRLLIGFCALFSLAVQAAPLTPPKGASTPSSYRVTTGWNLPVTPMT